MCTNLIQIHNDFHCLYNNPVLQVNKTNDITWSIHTAPNDKVFASYGGVKLPRSLTRFCATWGKGLNGKDAVS